MSPIFDGLPLHIPLIIFLQLVHAVSFELIINFRCCLYIHQIIIILFFVIQIFLRGYVDCCVVCNTLFDFLLILVYVFNF